MNAQGAQARLLERARELEAAAAELPERGRVLLQQAARRMRDAAEMYAADPTLVDDPVGRERPLMLIEELGRQIKPLVRRGCGPEHPRWPAADVWAEAEALAGRLPELVTQAWMLARPDYATPEGSQTLSQLWLEAAHRQVMGAGERLYVALRRAQSLPYPTPEAAELAMLADQIVAKGRALGWAWEQRQMRDG